MAEFHESFGRLDIPGTYVDDDQCRSVATSSSSGSSSSNGSRSPTKSTNSTSGKCSNSNPFAAATEEYLEEAAGVGNPFAIDDENVEEFDCPPPPLEQQEAVKTPPPRRPRSNPFDDGEIEEEDTEEALIRRREVTESLAPFTLASMMNGLRTASSESTPSAGDVPYSKLYHKEIIQLMHLGFDKVCVTNALVKTSGDADRAQSILKSRLLDVNILGSNRELYVWRSPAVVRVGGWLPNVSDSQGDLHTAYYINVTMSLGNETWRLGRRYSEFYNFYCAMYPFIKRKFPSGMSHRFPTDRTANWFGAPLETINKQRREKLDGWMREVCNSAAMMLDSKVRAKVFEFLAVDEELSRIDRSQGSHHSASERYYSSGQTSETANSSGKNKPFRSRSLPADGQSPTATTPSTSSFLTPKCCKTPVLKMTGGYSTHTLSMGDIRSEYSAGGGGGPGSIGLPLSPGRLPPSQNGP